METRRLDSVIQRTASIPLRPSTRNIGKCHGHSAPPATF